MSNFGGMLDQPKKMKLILGISLFLQHNSTSGGFLILKQIIRKVHSINIWTGQSKLQLLGWLNH
jgi:hypothetical protein